MGPRQSSQIRSKQQEFFSNYDIIQQIPSQNIRFLQHKQTKKQYLLRQLSYNDKKQYLKAIQTVRTKKQQLKNADHVTPITDYFQKEEDQYCSTFYKLYVLFEYPQRTLDDEVNERNLRKNNFSETELWSILASCILGLGHLQRKGIKHGTLKSSMVFLSQQGNIKISDPFTTGCQTNYQTLLNKRTTRHIYLSPQQCQSLQNQTISPLLNQYKSDIFTLGMIILECGLLQYQDQCYRDQYSRIHWETLEYNKNRFRRNYSQELGNMLEYMLGEEANSRPQWIQLENYVITDTMGKSFISQGRKSAMIGYSKPVSVNINKFAFEGSQNNINTSQKQFSDKKIINNQQASSINKGIGISSSKPNSVQKIFNPIQNTFQTRRPEFTTEFRPPTTIYHQNQGSSTFIKPKSVVNMGGFTSNSITSINPIHQSNIITSVPGTQYNYSQSPVKITKNFDISPINVSNINNTRPFRSIFPNPYYETKTKADENLVQMQQDDEISSRHISSQASHNIYQKNENITGFRQTSPYNNTNTYYNTTNIPYASHYDQNIQSNYNNITNTNNIKNNYMNSSLSNNIEKKVYQGQFVIQTFKLGSRYQGYKLNGMRHGPGKFFYQDGGMYDGNWVKNKMEGYGKLYYQSGKIAYEGQWVQDQFTGHGILYNQNPDLLSQPFDYENFDNVQELWTKYQGEFSDDSKNGKGILYLSNGQYFEGNFVNDTAQGEGVYTTMNGKKIRGIWQNNALINRF